MIHTFKICCIISGRTVAKARAIPIAITLIAILFNGTDNSKCLALSTSQSIHDAPRSQPKVHEPSIGFWNDPLLVQSLPDPPSDELLKLIQAKPYRGGFEPARESDAQRYEHGYAPVIVQGSIPQDLVGSLATNGPGRIRIKGRQYGHWFDGDGFVTLLTINGQSNKITFQAKYVKTKRYKAQQSFMLKNKMDGDAAKDSQHGPPLAFSGAWTLGGEGKWYENIFRFPTNPANTATVWLPPSSKEVKDKQYKHKPRLFAICEGGHPIELDPITLDTLQDGETPFTSSDGKETTKSFFSAHFSHCPYTGDIYNHGYLIRPGPLQNEINVMKLNKYGELLQQETSPLPFDSFVHDSVLSQNFMIYFLPPFYIPENAIVQSLAGLKPLGNLAQWDSTTSTKLHVHSKHNLKLQWVIDLPNTMSMYHLVDAHEMEANMETEMKIDQEGDTILAVRVLVHEPLDREGLELQFTDQYRVENNRIMAILKEYKFRLGANGVSAFISCTNVASDAAECEYPALNLAFNSNNESNGKNNCNDNVHQRRRYCWTNAASTKPTEWPDGIQKVDMQERTTSRVVTFGEGSYAGAPAFIPRRNSKDRAMTAEDDGFILTTIYRSLEHRSDVAILDASTLELLCLMELEHHVPYQFHGDFVDGFIGDER